MRTIYPLVHSESINVHIFPLLSNQVDYLVFPFLCCRFVFIKMFKYMVGRI